MLKEKFLATIKKYNMLTPNDKILIAVSGGPDSVAMLYLLKDLAPKLNLKLHIAHLNHMLRLKEADRDMRSVISLSQNLQMPVTTAKIDVYNFVKKHKLSLEEGARILRYDFLLKASKKIGAKKIAIAHNQDDQVETVLMRLIRGSGLLGLSAISPIRQINGCLIIRPMINISRREVLEFLQENKIKYCLDSSNRETVFLRNKIRKGLLPYLEKNYKSTIKKILSRLAENISLDYQFLDQIAQKIFEKIAKFEKGTLAIPLTRFQKYHISLQKQIFRRAIGKIKGDLNKIEEKHYYLLLDLVKNKKLKILELPSQIWVRKNEHKIIFSKKYKSKITKPALKIRLKMPGKTKLPHLNLILEAKLLKKVNLFSLKRKRSHLIEYLDYGQLKLPLFVRFRKSGDRFQPLGMQGVKALKEFFIDEKIPQERRHTIPLVCDQKNILWVAGYRISEKVKITSNTKHILKLILLKNKLRN